MNYQGIDVSQWQGSKIDYKKVKEAGINFVIIRAGYGKSISQKDPCFETNYKNAKAAGLNVGAYWYSYAKTLEDAKAEASTCIQAIKGKQFEMPIYFDLEEQSQFARGKTFCSNLVKIFCSAMEAAGYWTGLYISRSPMQAYITDEVYNRYSLWLAEYGPKCNYGKYYGMWQYSSKGKIDGISGDVDLDVCYEDYPARIKAAGLNGFTKQATSKPATPKKTVDELAKEVIAGKWSAGDERKKLLTVSGYDYSAVQKRVNEMLASIEKYKVTNKTGLNIRAGAGISHKIVGSLAYGTAVAVTNKKKVGTQYWGRLVDGRGWICLTGFAEKIN